MTQIILTDDQLQAVRQATDSVEVRDQSGNLIAYLAKQPMSSPEEITEARSRLGWSGPWHTTEQFIARFRELEKK